MTRRPNPYSRLIKLVVATLVLTAAAVLWVAAVERWIAEQIHSLARTRLVPSLEFDDLSYSPPRTVTMRGVRLSSPDPDVPGESVEILAMESLRVVLAGIPQPERSFRMKSLEIEEPTLRLVRIPMKAGSDGLLGFSRLLLDDPESRAAEMDPPPDLSASFEVRVVTLDGGRVEYDPRDGRTTTMLIEGIQAHLLLKAQGSGSYGVDFALDHLPISTVTLQGSLHLDQAQLEVASLSMKLELARKHDHYLTPALQKFVAARDITGSLAIDATGVAKLDGAASSIIQTHFVLTDASITAGDHGMALDRVEGRLSTKKRTATLEKLTIDGLGGHASMTGYIELYDDLAASLRFEGEDFQIADLLRSGRDPNRLPRYEGLLDFSGTLRGPLAEFERRAGGEGRLSLRKARLGRLPVLSEVDEAIDPLAENEMKRERKGHDALSLSFSLENDRAKIENLRMNSGWYGLRGHGEVISDSRLDFTVEAGPLQRLENEMGDAGDVLGEITQTLLRAHVADTLQDPKVSIEILRQGLH